MAHRIVNGTCLSNGNLALGIAWNTTVIAVSIVNEGMYVDYVFVSGGGWYAHVENGANISISVHVLYLQ